VIAIDTNILVYAHRRDSSFHQRARDCLHHHAQGDAAWAIPWPCVHEFLAIVTHPRIFKQPTPVAAALTQIESWLESPTLRLLGEEEGYWSVLADLIRTNNIRGGKVHDARIAALAIHHGARELLSADRDFTRMAPLTVRNPLSRGCALTIRTCSSRISASRSGPPASPRGETPYPRAWLRHSPAARPRPVPPEW
jgi:toxin-antitoxin system PIN domain toxin